MAPIDTLPPDTRVAEQPEPSQRYHDGQATSRWFVDDLGAFAYALQAPPALGKTMQAVPAHDVTRREHTGS